MRNPTDIDLTEGQIAEVMIITPEMAKHWLDLAHAEKSFQQRHLKGSRVDRYAKNMTGDKWALNGETIVFDTKGIPIDGQNRLNACVKAGVPFKTWAIRNVRRECFYTFDCGSTRTLSDSLHIKGKGNETQLATAIRWLNAYLTHSMKSNSGLEPMVGLNTLAEHPDLEKHVAWALERPRFRGVQPSILSVASYICHKIDPKKADEFFSYFRRRDGDVWRSNSPAAVLVSKLQGQADQKRQSRFDYVRLAELIKAWNYFIAGVVTQSITFKRAGSDRPEYFPRAMSRVEAVQYARKNRLYERMDGENPKDIPSVEDAIEKLGLPRRAEVTLKASGCRKIGELMDSRSNNCMDRFPAIHDDIANRLRHWGFLRDDRFDGDDSSDE